VVDRALIQRKLRDLQRYVREVSEFREIDHARYREDWKTQRIVERTLQLAIEVCADVAAHLIADRALRAPSTYAEAFEILAEAGLLERDLRDVLVRMARFRNLLVYEYARIDPDLVVRVLRENLTDFEKFRLAAERWVGGD
jgi:uncharacterized protein YutE (UPF0331/DUF86 family)